MFGTSTDIESIYQKHLRSFRTVAFSDRKHLGVGGGEGGPPSHILKTGEHSFAAIYLTRGTNDNATKDICKLFSRNEIKKK